MIKNTKRMVCSFISVFVVILMLVTALPASAASTPINWSNKGSVSITLKYNKKAISGAEFTLYRVADAKYKNETLMFSYTPDFVGFSSNIKELSSANSPKRLLRYANDNNINGISLSTDENGYVNFSKLNLGLYLVAQTKSVKGYSDCSAFLIYIPFEEDGEWQYEVDATPKTDVKAITTKPTTTKGKPTTTGKTTNKTTNKTTTKPSGIDFGDGSDKTTVMHEGDEPITNEFGEIIENTTNGNGSGNGTHGGSNGSGSGNGSGSNSSGNGTGLYYTGQNKVLVDVLACSGVIMLSVGCILLYRGKKEIYD